MARRARRHHRRRRRSGLIDHLMFAGICGGAVWLALTHLTSVSGDAATLLSVLVGGVALGSRIRAPRVRSPFVWRGRYR